MFVSRLAYDNAIARAEVAETTVLSLLDVISRLTIKEPVPATTMPEFPPPMAGIALPDMVREAITTHAAPGTAQYRRMVRFARERIGEGVSEDIVARTLLLVANAEDEDG